MDGVPRRRRGRGRRRHTVGRTRTVPGGGGAVLLAGAIEGHAVEWDAVAACTSKANFAYPPEKVYSTDLEGVLPSDNIR